MHPVRFGSWLFSAFLLVSAEALAQEQAAPATESPPVPSDAKPATSDPAPPLPEPQEPPAAPPPAPPAAAAPEPRAPEPAREPLIPPEALDEPPPPPLWYERLAVDGTIDGYYQENVRHPRHAPLGRIFDATSRTFAVKYAKLGVGFSAEPVGGRLDLALSPGAFGGAGLFLQQAYVSAELPSWTAMIAGLVPGIAAVLTDAKVTADVGKFVTTAGAEVIESYRNYAYSHSLLFSAMPGTHVGVRLNIEYNQYFTLETAIVNGWDNDLDLERSAAGTPPPTCQPPEPVPFGECFEAPKTGELALKFKFLDGATVGLTSYFGREDGSRDLRVLLDLVASYNVPRGGVYLNGLLRREGRDGLNGLAVAGKLLFTKNPRYNVGMSARGEIVENRDTLFAFEMDDNGRRKSPVRRLYSWTAAVLGPVGQHLEYRLEFRGDHAREGRPFNADDTQLTLTGAALAAF